MRYSSAFFLAFSFVSSAFCAKTYFLNGLPAGVGVGPIPDAERGFSGEEQTFKKVSIKISVISFELPVK
ncbi:hypothetical protein E0W72_03625 [Flavobacterium arcticum]|uniref:hypothetical protein n=1 Tax=Flavobacterium arcticum TaxID=1784713 RepID=UPI0013C2FE42|nr:hypothetical protein [Flavobacterium arcticum]KAF2512325.1 hypothetical protein E0W72_03625 [Flavobacterium arcticum]